MSKRFGIGFIPPRRPREEWEHVHVTKGGRRFVKIDELLRDEVAVERIKEVAALTPSGSQYRKGRGDDS